jgi:two-component system, OmpR family, KDP operon response regulator KdpE
VTRVLIIEDEDNIRKFVALNLAARGYEVIEAANVSDGLALLRNSSPAMVLLDLKLPDRPGWDVLREMTHDLSLPQIPVVIITASLGNESPADIGYKHLREVLIKPVSVQQLTKVVKDALVS